jgi:precorrin-6B methylase 1
MNDAARECPTEVAKELEQIGRRGSLTVYAGQKLFYKKSDTHKLLLLSLINLYTIHS